MLELIPAGPADPMYYLKKKAEEDTSAGKVDVGVGIYRDESGRYQELEVVKEAKQRLAALNLGHDYELTTGDDAFLQLAAGVMFGQDSGALRDGRISSVQTLSGTGANHLAALLLATTLRPMPTVYVGVPTWSNTVPLFEQVGFSPVTYSYIDASTGRLDLATCLETIRSAPRGSIFSFQGCCHNPLGIDINASQWKLLAAEMKACGHIAIIDIAYQGLGEGIDEDAAGVRIFADEGVDVLVCQSFSKNFALYGERCGALHVVAAEQDVAARVKDQLRALIRREYSSAPAYGARLVRIVLEDRELSQRWLNELASMRARLRRNRDELVRNLVEVFKTPGDWQHISTDKGLFSCLALSPEQCRKLVEEHHVHLPLNGRINVAGLSLGNVERTARAIDKVVRDEAMRQDSMKEHEDQCWQISHGRTVPVRPVAA